MNKLPIKALGQTIEHDGEIVLVVKDMPANCMVLFISLNTWEKIKENVVIEENDQGAFCGYGDLASDKR